MVFFLIIVRIAGSHIRFDAKNAGKAMEWVEAIRQAISEEQIKEQQRVSQSLNLVCTPQVHDIGVY